MRSVVKKVQKSLSNMFVLLPVLAVVSGLLAFSVVTAFSADKQASGGSCKGICVALTPDGMNPNELAVRAGEYVQFYSADGKQHNISLGEGAGGSEDHGHGAHEGKHEHTAGYASGDFGADEAWRVQFKEPGTYQLHDHYNPKLNILVVVYEETASTQE